MSDRDWLYRGHSIDMTPIDWRKHRWGENGIPLEVIPRDWKPEESGSDYEARLHEETAEAPASVWVLRWDVFLGCLASVPYPWGPRWHPQKSVWAGEEVERLRRLSGVRSMR